MEESRLDLVGPNEVLANGLVSINDLAEVLDLRLEDLEADEVDTVAGLVYSRLGRIPVVGDRVDVDGITLEVASVARRRIRLVRVLKHAPPEGEETAQD